MTDGNKNQRHQFLNYMEDYQEIADAKNFQEQEEQSWLEDSHNKQQHQRKFLFWVYGLSAVFLLGIVFFWWNVSRAQFYQALDNPLSDSSFQKFLLLVDDAKQGNTDTDFDWRNQLDEIDSAGLTGEEQQVLADLKKKVNDGASLEELINDLK